MSASVPWATNVPSPSKKRLKLAIRHDSDDNSLIFTLSELEGGNRAVKDHLAVTTEVVKVRKETLEHKGVEWRETVEEYENQFLSSCAALEEKLLSEGTQKGLANRDLLEYICSRPEWGQMLSVESKKLAKNIGQYILEFSDDLLEEFLPKPETDFAKIFDREVNAPTLEAYASDNVNYWWGIPLLQLRVEKDMLCLPWWLSRTYDKKSLWSCRYALAVSPTLDDTEPPAILMEKGEGVHLLSITRPTFDLQSWLPIFPETADAAYGLIANGVLSWRVLDGLIGDERLDQTKSNPFDLTQSSGNPFQGVRKRAVRDALRTKKNSPNLVVYQGHWFNHKRGDRSEEPPFLGLHDNRFHAAKPEENVRLTHGLLPVPLLSLVPENSQHKILIMNGCSSAAAVNQGRIIQKYVQARSVFIGANYPLLADLSAPSIDGLIRSVLKNHYLAHAVSEVSQLQSDLNSANPDVLEVFQKAGLCVFGDVRTSLRKEFDEQLNDNRGRLTMKLTDKWADALDELGLRKYDGMTYKAQPQDLPPAWDFMLTGPGPEIALVPLVVAIDLCDKEQDPYVILGPAFSSTESVALVASNLKDLRSFNSELASRIRNNQKVIVGLLSKRLTSSYMTELFLRHEMKGKHRNSQGEFITGEAIWRDFLQPRYASEGVKQLTTRTFLENVDIGLVLNEPRGKIRSFGNVLAEDLETKMATLLGLESNLLPRGILITKKKYLQQPNQEVEILEYCADFNKQVRELSNRPPANPNDGQPDNIALLTTDCAKPAHLNAIKKFAETDFFRPREFGWDNFLYKPRTWLTKSEATGILDGLEQTTNFGKRSKEAFNANKVSASELLNDFNTEMFSIFERNERWQIEEVQRQLFSGVQSLSVAEVIREDIRSYLVKQMDDLNLTERVVE